MLDAKALAEMTAGLVREYVGKAFAPLADRLTALEARKVPEHGRDGKDGKDGKDGVAGRDGRDGLGVVGERGLDGKDGSNGIDGTDGRNGIDGLGFDDLEMVHDGERNFIFRFAQGERVKEFPFTIPLVLDRGVYKAEQEYGKGDAVTWAGSLWIAQQDTKAKPDGGADWRLAVKRGRDGKDAR